MPLFGKSDKTKTQKSVLGPDSLSRSGGELEQVILAPRVTEKAAVRTQDNVYTFNIDPRANKVQVARAVEAIYKVRPIKVRVAYIKPKTVMRRRIKGRKSGGKKAYVYLKKGDSIEFI